MEEQAGRTLWQRGVALQKPVSDVLCGGAVIVQVWRKVKGSVAQRASWVGSETFVHPEGSPIGASSKVVAHDTLQISIGELVIELQGWDPLDSGCNTFKTITPLS